MAQYLKPDTELGYIEDSADIECLKMNNLRHVILGCMLGDFDEVGSYVVSPEIKKELIAMDKYIVESFDNIELCKSELKLDKQISFMVTFEGNSATLSLIEKIHYEGNFKLNGGTYSNINEYMLDKVETSGEINRNALYSRWHIKAVPGEIIDIFSCDDEVLAKYFGIVKRFKYLLAANKTLLEKEEKLEEVEAEHVTEMFKILKHYPKLQQAVVANLNQTFEIKKNAVNVKNPFFVKTFNEILGNTINLNLGVLNEQEKANFLSEKHNAVTMMNVKCDAIMEADHVKSNEGEQNIVMLKTDPLYENRTVNELATLFAGEHQQAINRLNGKDTLIAKTVERNGGVESSSKHKEQLFETLQGLGIKVGEQKEVVKEPAKADVEAAPAAKAETKAAAPAKSASPAKKPEAKKAASKGGASKGGGGGGGKKSSSDAKKANKPAEAKKAAASKPNVSLYRQDISANNTTKSVYIGKGVLAKAKEHSEEAQLDDSVILASRIIGDYVQAKKEAVTSKNAGTAVGTAYKVGVGKSETSADLNNLT